MANADNWLEINKLHHDRFADDYAEHHVEIYNETEQARLTSELHAIVSNLRKDNQKLHALDFGTGAGNLTGILLNLGCKVTATDVSEGCMRTVSSNFDDNNSSLETSLLNGIDLSQFSDDTFDLCATYSVLHHVPDYLHAVRELARVTKPGGVIFIDHESSPQSWIPSHDRNEYVRQVQTMIKPSFFDRWGPKGLLHRVRIKLKKIKNPRYQEEGDIHIWDDDHIEWDEVESALREQNIIDIKRSNYLVCRERGKLTPLYDIYKDRYHDMSMLIGYKKRA